MKLHWKLYVMSSDVQLSTEFYLKDVLLFFALLSNAGLSHTPWATSDFSSAVVDSYREPDKPHFKQVPWCAFLPQGFLQSPDSPSGAWGINTPRYTFN